MLLGLVQGHFNLLQDVAFKGDPGAAAQVPINAGIAVVVPTQKIVQLIEDRF